MALAAATLGCGATSGQAAGLRIVPTADASLTVVDSSLPGGSDTVLSLRPGVQIGGQSGRFRLAVVYRQCALHHLRSDVPQADTLQNALNASLNGDLLDRWLFLDANASISQQTISAYGQQSVDGLQVNSNRTEVSQLSIRPSLRGALSDLATYQLGLSADATRARNGGAAGSHGTGASFSLASASEGTRLGWSAQLSTQRAAYSGSSNTSDNTRVILSLLARIDRDLAATLRGGQESTAVSTVYRQRYANWGGDLRWVPSNRSSVSLSYDERYFGHSYQASLDHRMARSSLRFSSNRDVSNSAGAIGVGQPVTVYQLLFNQFASLQPDPLLREQLVRDFLLSIKQDPNAQVTGGFLNGGATLQTRNDLALSYAGLRSTLIVQAYTSNSRRIDIDAAAQQREPVRQAGLTTSLNHRLTPTSSLSLTGTRLRTLSGATQEGNQLSSASLAWSEQFSRYLSTSLSARYALFQGPSNPYHETALNATLGLRF
jgi:uncharacterized protein (PEP-CTERM system associated)